ncbi:MAG: polyphosphate kinase 2 family protein [Planctomycetota bacterium]
MLPPHELVERYRVMDRRFTLAKADTVGNGADKDALQARLAQVNERLGELQERLYAQDHWAVLVILQGMDAAGKDGVVKHVLSGVNPAGCQVFAFKAPNDEELDHDFLWRAARALPERGRIGIFNRSYYEEVVTVRVHPEFLARQRLPKRCVTEAIWDERLEDIAAFERYLGRNGVLVRKFFLHVSRAEQKQRFLERIDTPEKHWKFNARDVAERGHWDQYQELWTEALARTSTAHAPWTVVPADRKWFARLVVAETLVAALEELELDFPKLDERRLAELGAARRTLTAEE